MTSISPRLSGVLSPVLTPFDPSCESSAAGFVRHCRALLRQDIRLAAFGTNSEANSLILHKQQVLLGAGLPADRMMSGIGVCALPNTIELTRHAVASGFRGVLIRLDTPRAIFQQFPMIIRDDAGDCMAIR